MNRSSRSSVTQPNNIPHPEDTAVTVLITEHYRRIGIIYGWTSYRFCKLAKALGVKPHELGRLVGIFTATKEDDDELPDHRMFLKMLRSNHFPPSVAVTLSIIEDGLSRAKALKRGQPLDRVAVLPLEDIMSEPEVVSRAD